MKTIKGYKIVGLLLCFLGMMLACKKDKAPSGEHALMVSAFYPNSGKGGTLVTITGKGFNAAKGTVSFGDKPAEVISLLDTAMVVRAPEDGQSGDITIKNDTKSVTVGSYTYQQLSVQSVSPANGPAGSHIRIIGSGFSSTQAPVVVLINGKPAIVSSASDTMLVVEIPDAAGSGPVTVRVDGAESVGAPFRYQAISGIKPLTGGKGTQVKISGTGFLTAVAGDVVDFNGKPAVVISATEEQLVVTAPDQVSTGPLSVTINGQKITGPVFTIVPFPVIKAVAPLSGPAGQQMTITGLNFSNAVDENVVTINNVAVPVKAASATQLQLTIPAGVGTGKVLLAVNNQAVEGPVFTEQNLGITQLLPDNGLAGALVKISGVGFSEVTTENIVTFNGVAAVVNSANDSVLQVTVPVGVSTGPVVVRRAALTAQSPTIFNRAGVQTLAGGPGSNALSSSINSIVVDSKGNVFVGDNRIPHILKITPDGTVSVFAGGPSGQYGNADGKGTDALFNSIGGLAIDAADNLYVADGVSRNVRKITPQGDVKAVFSNLATPVSRLAMDPQGNLYGTQSYYGILKMYPDGSSEKVYTVNVNDGCKPAIDAQANIYFCNDMYQPYISLRNPVTAVTTQRWLGTTTNGYQDGSFTTALFYFGMSALVTDATGNILVLDGYNYAIRKADLTTNTVSTVFKGASGYADGSFQDVKMGVASDMALDKDGNIYVVDPTNKAIRKIILK